jgi:aspartate/methionine/tyrosine aminotransferase
LQKENDVPGEVFAKRISALDKETSLEILARAKALEAEGREIIHLEIGEPDFETPDNIKQAAIRALREGYTHYGPSAGLPEARDAVARYISGDRGVDVERDQVVITPGAKSVIFFTMLALVEPGDEVIYPNPGFPNYEMTIDLLGAKGVPVPLEEDRGFSIDLDRFESLVTKNTKLCVINSPHNPTGGMLPRDVLEGILDIASRNDFYILSDEIYSKIVYDGSYDSMYSLPGAAERTILLDGHSKTYAMTGWRLGYAVMPKSLVKTIGRIAGNSTSCTCSFTQMAGIEALEGPQDSVDKMVEEFRVRRDIIVDGLNSLPGTRCHKPAGAFYVFPNIRDTKLTSKELSNLLLNEAGVAVLSGTTFGEYGEGYIRMSYANSQGNIHRAIDRIASVLRA